MTKFWTLPLELKPAGGPFDDPALLVAPTNCELSILFDCGTLHGLKTRDLQKVRWLFLTHLHIDHLIGFDHLLRVRLFSSLPLTVYGPCGTIEVISHRLKGYAWNLTSGSPFKVRVFECPTGGANGAEFSCNDRFDSRSLDSEALPEVPTQQGTVTLVEGLSVHSHPVSHGVPCLGYRLDRRTPSKFSLDSAQSLGLSTGPWVRKLIAGEAVTQMVNGQARDQEWLAARLLAPAAQHSLGFLTDTRLDETLTGQLVEFFRDVDLLCCETAYLDCERELAAQNLHMTTVQAARLACLCKAREMRIFHLSRRHCESGSARHLAEVRQVFANSGLLGASRSVSESPS